MRILVADHATVWRVDPGVGMEAGVGESEGVGSGGGGHGFGAPEDADPRPTAVAWVPGHDGVALAGSGSNGLYRSEDGGRTWVPSGLPGERIMALAASPARDGLVWAGTEPSAVYRSTDAGRTWEARPGLDALPSSSEWAFPPRPETHHVRWIACHPSDPDRLWAAIEAGALIRTADGGESWQDRVSGGPYDTHELAIHPERPDTLRVAAGDGYYESHDGGDSWERPRTGLDVRYLRSVAIDPGDPDTVVVSGASGPRTAYAVTDRADGRLYRRTGDGPWQRIRDGRPEPPGTIAPLLAPGTRPGELFAADERGVQRSGDGGESWEAVASFEKKPAHLRGLAVTG